MSGMIRFVADSMPFLLSLLCGESLWQPRSVDHGNEPAHTILVVIVLHASKDVACLDRILVSVMRSFLRTIGDLSLSVLRAESQGLTSLSDNIRAVAC